MRSFTDVYWCCVGSAVTHIAQIKIFVKYFITHLPSCNYEDIFLSLFCNFCETVQQQQFPFLFIVLGGGRRKGALSELIVTASVQCFTDIYGMLIFSPFQKRNLIAPRPAVKSSFLLAVQKIPSWLKATLLLVNAVHSRAVVCVILQAAWGRFASLAIWTFWFLRHQESQGNAVISMNVNQVKVDLIFFFPFFYFFLSDKHNNLYNSI